MVSSQDATAATISIASPSSPTYDITGRARRGNSGFEGILFTPANPSPTGINMNPVGAPVWNTSLYYDFALNYTASTGTAVWSIDFNRDNDFLDSAESVSSVSPSLIGQTFNYADLRIEGNAVSAANVTNFTINGTNFGTYNSGAGVVEKWFADSSGLFGDVINITGQLNLFWSAATSTEIPRVWVRLGEAEALPVVPVPAAAGLGFLGMGLVGFLRRRKNAKA